MSFNTHQLQDKLMNYIACGNDDSPVTLQVKVR